MNGVVCDCDYRLLQMYSIEYLNNIITAKEIKVAKSGRLTVKESSFLRRDFSTSKIVPTEYA